MDREVDAMGYGICIFSADTVQDFLKREKIRKRKLLSLLQKDKELYLSTQKEGILIPLVGINAYNYAIRLEGRDEPFDDRGTQKIDYDGFNLEIKDKEIFGILGPSGAGKTTLIKLITGQLDSQNGEILVDGCKPDVHNREFNRKFGIMMDGLGLYERLTCYENVLLFARIYNVIDSYVVDVLKQVGLGEHLNKTVNKLSTGMKQRVLLARAIIHSPAILVLDEPTSGLDPVTADEIHKIIKEIRHMGTTVLLTTHNMNEADKLCNRIALLNKGGIIECNEPEAIKRKYFKSGSVCIHTKNEKDIYLDLEKQKSELINLIHSGDIETIHSQEPCLEDIFINLTGEKINDK